MYNHDIVKSLSTLPADDGNFKSALSGATANQLVLAIQIMEENGRQNKTRIAACKKALKRRTADARS